MTEEEYNVEKLNRAFKGDIDILKNMGVKHREKEYKRRRFPIPPKRIK